MKVQMLYFAAVAELVGSREEALELPSAVGTVRELARLLEERHPALRGRLGQVRFAVNEEFASADRTFAEGDVVAVIPPVAGGSDRAPASERVAVLEEPLSLDRVTRLVRHPGAGAIATFVGIVRDHSDGKDVSALEYSAYESMAVAEMARVIEEIEAEMPVVRLAVHHRIGLLSVGDDAVICAASSPHRDDAFVAGRALIDRIKDRVPVWKRERVVDGTEEWVGWDDARRRKDG